MPIGARSPSATPSPVIGWTSGPAAPLPFELLLRSDGGGRPPAARPGRLGIHPAAARALLARDAVAVLAAGRGIGVPDGWRRPGFAARVERTRRELAPVSGPAALASSLAREALHSRSRQPAPCAVRAAYALRWLELTEGVTLPTWAAWIAPCGDERTG
jgi:hypothetical protein